MDSESAKIDTLLRVATALVTAMGRLLNLLPRAAPIQVHGIPTAKIETPRLEDIAIQEALDEVLEYHWVHRPKNTTKNYEPKQKE
jgi:hypothetical protein